MSAFSVCVVDSLLLLDQCIADLSSEHATQLAIDLEGVKLDRKGRLSLVQILADTSNTIWLVDVTTLGATAFVHLDAEGRSLQSILEGLVTQKLFFDVRSDADALWNLYGVKLANVYDIQLLEVAMKRSTGKTSPIVTGLGAVIEIYLGDPGEWKKVKDEGIQLFQPRFGGAYEIFEQRPLDPRIIAYAAQDVALLFDLRRVLEARMGVQMSNWKNRVIRASARREAESRKPYRERGRHRAIAPRF